MAVTARDRAHLAGLHMATLVACRTRHAKATDAHEAAVAEARALLEAATAELERLATDPDRAWHWGVVDSIVGMSHQLRETLGLDE